MEHTIFISYSTKDTSIANELRADLEAAGLGCWIAPRDITPGEDWPTAIVGAVSRSRVMVLLFSSNANASADVSRELHLANDARVPIVALRLENVTPSLANQYCLADAHWLDANPPAREQFPKLIELLKSLWPDLAAADDADGSAKRGFFVKLLSFLNARPARTVRRVLLAFVVGLVKLLAMIVVALLVVGIVFVLVGSTALAHYAEATLGEYAWDFSSMSTDAPYELSPKLFADQVTPYLEQHTFRTITDSAITFTTPDRVEVSAKMMGLSVKLDGTVDEIGGLPEIRLQHLNNLPLPIIDGIISDGINQGLHIGWSRGPVQIRTLGVVGDSLIIETTNKSATEGK